MRETVCSVDRAGQLDDHIQIITVTSHILGETHLRHTTALTPSQAFRRKPKEGSFSSQICQLKA